MATTITAHLSFKGNCREAMAFYKDCFGGELSLQGMADGPMADTMPPEMRDKIMHASLTSGSLMLMGSDMNAEGVKQGDNVTLMLTCSSNEEIKRLESKLAAGGQINHPVQDAFWGGLFGHLIDKYGFTWMLYYDGANG